MEKFVSVVLMLRVNFKALNQINCLSGCSLLPPDISFPYFSAWMLSFLFSVLHIIYTTVYFIFAET